jgi:hypothetical protein
LRQFLRLVALPNGEWLVPYLDPSASHPQPISPISFKTLLPDNVEFARLVPNNSPLGSIGSVDSKQVGGRWQGRYGENLALLKKVF